MYKNGLGVGIPGTGERGIPIAAALGALIGRSEQGLEVLSAVTLAVVHQAKELVEQGRVDVTFDPALSGKMCIRDSSITASMSFPLPYRPCASAKATCCS